MNYLRIKDFTKVGCQNVVFFVNIPFKKCKLDTKKIIVNQDALAIGERHFSELFNAFYLSDRIHHIKLTDEAYKSFYGFESQGDTHVNSLFTLRDQYRKKFHQNQKSWNLQ